MHWRSISNANRISLYGCDPNSRIFDPEDHNRIFSWLICQSYDDRGNAMIYQYKAEDSTNVDLSQACESNRDDKTRSTPRYIKRVKYRNMVSRLVQPDLSQMNWHFEVVFDYGEHFGNSTIESSPWLARNDPFSSFKAGFDVRTYRLCQRILMFHHFPSELGVGKDCLVSSMDLQYRNTRQNSADTRKGNPVLTLLASAAHTTYQRNGSTYLSASFPPLEFKHSQAVISQEVKTVDLESPVNIPSGLRELVIDSLTRTVKVLVVYCMKTILLGCIIPILGKLISLLPSLFLPNHLSRTFKWSMWMETALLISFHSQT